VCSAKLCSAVTDSRPSWSVVRTVPSQLNRMPGSTGAVCTVTVIGHGLRLGCGRFGGGVPCGCGRFGGGGGQGGGELRVREPADDGRPG
jgi:hypothetical protein